MRFRWVVIALTLAAFGAAIAAFTQVQQQFFPTSSRPELFIEIRMPEGILIGVTEAAAKKAEVLAQGDADLEYYTTISAKARHASSWHRTPCCRTRASRSS